MSEQSVVDDLKNLTESDVASTTEYVYDRSRISRPERSGSGGDWSEGMSGDDDDLSDRGGIPNRDRSGSNGYRLGGMSGDDYDLGDRSGIPDSERSGSGRDRSEGLSGDRRVILNQDGAGSVGDPSEELSGEDYNLRNRRRVSNFEKSDRKQISGSEDREDRSWTSDTKGFGSGESWKDMSLGEGSLDDAISGSGNNINEDFSGAKPYVVRKEKLSGKSGGKQTPVAKKSVVTDSSSLNKKAATKKVQVATEETATQRVQVNAGYENPEIPCLSTGCSGVLLKWVINFYGTEN